MTFDKNKFLEIRNSQILEEYFVANIAKIFSELNQPKIIKFNSNPFRLFDSHDAVSSIIKCHLEIKDFEGKTHNHEIIINSHSDGSRFYTYEVMKEIYRIGLGDNNFTLPKPLTYIDQWRALVYENFPGTLLADFLQKKKGTFDDLLANVKKASCWLVNFQKVSFEKLEKILHTTSDQKYLDSQIEEVIKKNPEIGKEIKPYLLLEKLSGDQKCLAHGDFQFTNIIIGENKTAVIDYELTHLGHPMWDVGCFFVQVDNLGFDYYTENELEEIKNDFLESYQSLGGKIELNNLAIAKKHFYAKAINYYLFFEGLTKKNERKIKYLKTSFGKNE